MTPDEQFDLAKQIRIAERNKRYAMRLGNERLLRDYRFRYWGVMLAVACICAVLAMAISCASNLVKLIQ